MTRNQFFATFAAIPFIGKMFKTKSYVPIKEPKSFFISTVETGDGLGYPSIHHYQAFGTPHEGKTAFFEFKPPDPHFYDGEVKIFKTTDCGETWSGPVDVSMGDTLKTGINAIETHK